MKKHEGNSGVILAKLMKAVYIVPGGSFRYLHYWLVFHTYVLVDIVASSDEVHYLVMTCEVYSTCSVTTDDSAV